MSCVFSWYSDIVYRQLTTERCLHRHNIREGGHDLDVRINLSTYSADTRKPEWQWFHSLIVGSLRQTQFSSNQFCHCCPDSSRVHPLCFTQVVPSPESFFRRILGLVSSRLAILHISVIFCTFSLSFGLLVCGPSTHFHLCSE